MFSYCGNNSVICSDPSGYYCVSILDTDPDCGLFITDQAAPGIAEKQFGIVSVSHGGCGAIATYNASLVLNDGESFDTVLGYYNSKQSRRLTAGGLLGMFPGAVASYFEEQGYTVVMTDSWDGIEVYSKTANACIMYYAFPREYGSLKLVGAHFVAYQRVGDKYTAYITESSTGVSSFSSPVDYAYRYGRLYAIGIFIYE